MSADVIVGLVLLVLVVGWVLGALLQSSPRLIARREAAAIDTEWRVLNGVTA